MDNNILVLQCVSIIMVLMGDALIWEQLELEVTAPNHAELATQDTIITTMDNFSDDSNDSDEK